MKVYQENKKRYSAQTLRFTKLLNKISLLRLLVFVIPGIIIIYWASINFFTPVYILFPIALVSFGAAINYHSKIAFLKKHSAFLQDINESEIQREQGNLEELDPGNEFIDPEHPYTSDLDIFGQHSIFQLVNRTTTESGRILLAKWLSIPASPKEILERQEAIKELTPELDWRQDFQAGGMNFQNKKSDYKNLLSWVGAPVVLIKNQLIYKAVGLILPILLMLSFYLFYANLNSENPGLYLLPIIVLFIVNFIIIRKINPLAENITEVSTYNLKTLEG